MFFYPANNSGIETYVLMVVSVCASVMLLYDKEKKARRRREEEDGKEHKLPAHQIPSFIALGSGFDKSLSMMCLSYRPGHMRCSVPPIILQDKLLRRYHHNVCAVIPNTSQFTNDALTIAALMMVMMCVTHRGRPMDRDIYTCEFHLPFVSVHSKGP